MPGIRKSLNGVSCRSEVERLNISPSGLAASNKPEIVAVSATKEIRINNMVLIF
jgi:hypothetical protein